MKRASLLLIAAFALTTTIACGDKKQDAEGGKGGTANAGGAKGAAKGGGKKIDEARATVLAEIKVPGFTQITKNVRKTMAQLTYKSEKANAKGKYVSLFAMLQPCMMCQKMDLAKWKANKNLQMMLSKRHKENPDLVWQVEEVEAGGIKGIYTYSLSFYKSPDGKTRSSSNSLNLYFNNGTNMMTVMINGKGIFPKSLEELKSMMTKDELVAAAKASLAAFATQL